MALESFYEDLVIDTPEAAAALTELFESDLRYVRGNTRYTYADKEFMRRLCEKYRVRKEDSESAENSDVSTDEQAETAGGTGSGSADRSEADDSQRVNCLEKKGSDIETP